jgi:hypothetical protein
MSAQDSSSNSENSVSGSDRLNAVNSASLQIIPPYNSSSPISLGYFVVFLIAVIMSWILVDVWTKVIDNLAYVTFKLNANSTWHSFIVASICTLVFLAYILVAEPAGGDVKLQILGSTTVSTLEPLSSVAS